jgi:ribose transport system permease protein
MIGEARQPQVRAAASDAPERARFGAMDASRVLKFGLFGLRAGPALILALLILVISLTTPIFFTERNLGNVLSQTAVIAVLALGQLLVIVTRGIDLSVGATLALSTVCGALVFNHVSGNGLLVIAVILATGLAVGLVNGAVFVWGRIPHPFIVTLATFSIARGIALWAANGTLIPGMPHSVQVLGGGTTHWVPYSAFLVGGIALAVVVLSTFLVWGRWLYAVGGNPEAARRTGVPVNRVLIAVYALSGLAAGVGGLITAGQTASGSPTFAEGVELDAIAAVIIGGAAFAGGRGHVGNALVGAFTIGVIRNALNLQSVNAFFQLMVIGVVVLLAVESDVIRGKVEDRFRVARATRDA